MANNAIDQRSFLSDVVSDPAMRTQRLAAISVCVIAAVVTALLLPFAAHSGPAMPGFIVFNQTALLVAYGLGSWVLFRQFFRTGALPIGMLAGGTLYTTAIVLLQMLSFPGAVVQTRVLGSGPETTTWLWTFWHLGPPICAIAYALAVRSGRPEVVEAERRRSVSLVMTFAAIAVAALSAVVSTAGLPWLPLQVVGDNYWAVTTSGVGPAIEIPTIVAVGMLWQNTRGRRTALDLWVAVSLMLLIFDNALTLAGGARATVGWYVGRMEALVSAFAILIAYLAETDALRQRAEDAAKSVVRAEAALRQAQKMEAVGRLTGGIAHDFNNLLMIVSSGFDMIRRRPDDRARVLKTAEAGLQAVDRGSKLTRQLLTFARRQNLRPETVNPNALLLAFENLARRAIGEAINLTFELSPTVHPTRIDAGEFEAAVLNLIVNARDAVPAQSGSIKVSTRNATLESADGHGLSKGGFVVVSVADNGTGMDEATRLQAFEPFFTTKEFGRGSGLGLSQAYGFAKATGGKVEIVTAMGQGTTVELWLPRAAADVSVPVVSNQAGSSSSPLRRAEVGETVLAVEDEPEVLAAVVENLADLGYTVISARDASEALDRLRAPGKIDILFSDIVMPGGMNGVQLAVETARIRPGIRVVLTSGYTGEALAGDHNVPADVAILTKPYRQQELADRLKLASSR